MINCPCGECAVRLVYRSELHGFCTVVSKARKCENRIKQELGLAAHLLTAAGNVQLQSPCCWTCVATFRLEGLAAALVHIKDPVDGVPYAFHATLTDPDGGEVVAAVVAIRPSDARYWETQHSPVNGASVPAGVVQVVLHAGNVIACFDEASASFDTPLVDCDRVKLQCENVPPLPDSAPLVCRHCLQSVRYTQAYSYEGQDGTKGHALNRVHFGCPRDLKDATGRKVEGCE